MLSTIEPNSPKGVTCSVCQKKFSRTDHLKRHQLRHSGVKPYSCIFCSDSFTRSDNLRDHYPDCTQRRNRQIPDAGRGGRRSHACDLCTVMKLGCDGENPCKTCRRRGISCKFSRLETKSSVEGQEATSRPIQENNQLSDRGSIKFLLNSGTASFIECFRFPSSKERKNISNFMNSTESQDASFLDFFTIGSENGSVIDDLFEDEPIDWSLFEDENLLRFLSSPLNETQEQADNMYVPLMLNQTFDTTISSLPFPAQYETANAQSAELVRILTDQAVALQISPQEQAEILCHLHYLFTPSKISNLINLYFEFWHAHCPILHQPSFHIDTTSPVQLLSMTLMGAMYSQIDQDVSTAKRILDLSELVVFAIPGLTDEFEIRQTLRANPGNSLNSSVATPPLAQSHLFAAYLMVVVQFWAGNMVSRKRAFETRFGVVIKAVRRLGVTKARHELDDCIDESLWIQKEMYIRLMCIISLLDCAFSFFVNYPCRLTLSELGDLPCEDAFFRSPHPFSMPNFAASRHITVYEAFQSLLGQTKPPNIDLRNKENPLGLHPLDMFILIHCSYNLLIPKRIPKTGSILTQAVLYVYTLTHMTLFSSSFLRYSGGLGKSYPSGTAGPLPDTNLVFIKQALSRWRSLWTTIRSSISNDAWANMGFFRNGYHFWLVTQLLVNNRGSADLMMRMEVGCDDTLTQLKGLLKESNTDT